MGNNINYKIIAGLVREVSTKISDERGSKCGYDMIKGMEEGDFRERYKAWVRYLKEKAEGTTSHVDEERNGIWVPAIMTTNEK